MCYYTCYSNWNNSRSSVTQTLVVKFLRCMHVSLICLIFSHLPTDCEKMYSSLVKYLSSANDKSKFSYNVKLCWFLLNFLLWSHEKRLILMTSHIITKSDYTTITRYISNIHGLNFNYLNARQVSRFKGYI